jgi:hypothetical protein
MPVSQLALTVKPKLITFLVEVVFYLGLKARQL